MSTDTHLSQRPAAPGRHSWRTVLITDGSQLQALKPEWDALYLRCPMATPFQSHSWVSSWWRHYGGHEQLFVLLVTDDSTQGLRGVLALTRSNRWGCRVLRPVAAPLTDYTDILLDPLDPGALAQTAADALLRTRGWDAMDFPEVRPGSALESMLACWPRRHWTMDASACLSMPARPLTEQLACLSGRNASNLRRALRKVDGLGVHVSHVGAEQVPAAMEQLLELHARQWAGRAINQEHLRPRFHRHLTQAATELVAAGGAALTQFWVGERLVAADFRIIGRDFAGGYLYGADPWLRTTGIDTFAMILHHGLLHASEQGLTTLSLLRGAEPHKIKWGAEPVQNHRMIFGRTVRANGYVAAVKARLHAARTLKQHFPRLAGARAASSASPPSPH
ncbi:GNAT family N-acetyltransferase [Nonomuraea soli]|uniref:CelD/BcsL family acetyltransferase involved in cellulose biosynthesis n=1 Tax=Nonomuraea soli TaxID=1032476 RepID=A0A7W0CHQ1_9ACTN|nr:GNAT family N-acetyltransferase [Nonomuraea soli]MBA2891402.1 CelD/BcsL family acetyltransferase involved in cellulose biosynthesis [Nonomuraea soli]